MLFSSVSFCTWLCSWLFSSDCRMTFSRRLLISSDSSSRRRSVMLGTQGLLWPLGLELLLLLLLGGGGGGGGGQSGPMATVVVVVVVGGELPAASSLL